MKFRITIDVDLKADEEISVPEFQDALDLSVDLDDELIVHDDLGYTVENIERVPEAQL